MAKFDHLGQIILDHSLCLSCQLSKGLPHLCSECQWFRAMDFLNTLEKRHEQSIRVIED